MQRRMLGLSIAMLSVLAALPARAQDKSPTAEHGSAALLLGYGFKDGVQFGLGARGGYTLPMNVYLGGTFVYHLGESIGSTTFNIFYLGVEGGYDISAGPVVVRPFLGLGPAFGHESSSGVDINGVKISGGGTVTKFGVWPGVMLLYPIQSFFIGADMRVLIVSGYTAFGLFATGGMQF